MTVPQNWMSEVESKLAEIEKELENLRQSTEEMMRKIVFEVTTKMAGVLLVILGHAMSLIL